MTTPLATLILLLAGQLDDGRHGVLTYQKTPPLCDLSL